MTATLQAMDPRAHDATDPPFASPVVAPIDMLGNWFVAQVQTTKVKTVAATLERVEGFKSYLPLEPVTKRYGTRVTRSWSRALMPGYLFANCLPDTEAEYAMRRLRDGIHGIIPVRDQARFARELQGIYLATMNGSVQAYRLPVVGQKCTVTEGGMRGVQGVLVSTTNRWRFVLQVEMLGRAVEVSVPPEWLETDGDEVAA